MSDLVILPPVKIGDRLVTRDFAKPGTCGFAAVGKPDVAVASFPARN